MTIAAAPAATGGWDNVVLSFDLILVYSFYLENQIVVLKHSYRPSNVIMCLSCAMVG
jgi:hypothetical protein